MNIDNRRLREIQREKIGYIALRDKSHKRDERILYEGKIESLSREEQQILARYKVKV